MINAMNVALRAFEQERAQPLENCPLRIIA
jgi:hypothetical protein